MSNNIWPSLFILSICSTVATVHAESLLSADYGSEIQPRGLASTAAPLKHNPFLRPDWLVANAQPQAMANNSVAVGLELRATVKSARIPMVLVNEQLLAVGESINGYLLLKVEEGQAIFTKNNQQLLLSVSGKNENIQ